MYSYNQTKRIMKVNDTSKCPKRKLKVYHGFLYYTRTDFMPFATLKIRPNYFNVLKYLIKQLKMY